jgi:hypothetical protein
MQMVLKNQTLKETQGRVKLFDSDSVRLTNVRFLCCILDWNFIKSRKFNFRLPELVEPKVCGEEIEDLNRH